MPSHLLSLRRAAGRLPRLSGLAWALVLLFAFFGLASDVFLLPDNLWQVLRSASPVGIVALGVLFPMMVRGIDVSVGSIASVSAMVAFNALTLLDLPWWAAVALALGVAVLLGAVNAFFCVRMQLPAILVTLGTLTAFRGLTRLISSKRQVAAVGIDDPIYQAIGGSHIGPVPMPVVILCVCALVAWYLLSRSGYGLACRAVGGNRLSAERAGVPIGAVVATTFLISAFAAGIAAVVLTSILTTTTEDLATGYEFSAITAAVVGGVSLNGGVGEVRGVLMGTVFVAFLTNGLILIGMPPEFTQVVTGVVLIGAVALNAGFLSRVFRRRQDERSAVVGAQP